MKIWNLDGFRKFDEVTITCPKCFIGNLKTIKGATQITPEGQEYSDIQYPNGIQHIFTAIFKCSSKGCSEIFSCVGELDKDIDQIAQDDHGEFYSDIFDFYQPKFFYPNLRYFDHSGKIPKKISVQIDYSFSNFFSDLASAANRLRSSVEVILDDIKAPKRTTNPKGKVITFRTLHDRIEHYKKYQKDISNLMMSIKVIGNEGSHNYSEIKKTDLIDGYEILFSILDRLYIKNFKRVVSIASEIVSTKRVRSKAP